MKVCVLGSGGWGIALALTLHSNGHDVTLWSHFEEESALLAKNRGNEKLLPGVKLPSSICITSDIKAAQGSDIVVLAVPSFAVCSVAQNLAPILPAGVVLVDVAKGLDKEHGYCRFSESIEKIMGGKNPVVALTGPTHAEEVARGLETAIVAASTDIKAAELCQDAFMNEKFRVYTSTDVIGAEIGGAFKNIIALACGITDGMGSGDNLKAALMTRGLVEITRLGVAMGAKRETFAGLSGIGDLIVTCTSMHSRNRRAGILIGQGVNVDAAMKQIGAVVEGYYATQAGYEMGKKLKVDMPITNSMYEVLYNNADRETIVHQLMTRAKKHETEGTWNKES